MKATFFITALVLTCGLLKAQFKNDNVVYKTIDPFELCNALQQSPGYVLLDEERSMASRNREQVVSAVKLEVMQWQEQEKEKP